MVAGLLTLNGTVDVSGSMGMTDYSTPQGNGGGGTGGSVFITCDTLLPSAARVTADGGCFSFPGAPCSGSVGSGGRIAIVGVRHSFVQPGLAGVDVRHSA
jgi:hypothetical protein